MDNLKRNSDDVEILPVSEVDESISWAELAFGYNQHFTNSLKRCRKCILPQTMPFIQFDNSELCNYCKDYQPTSLAGLNHLHDVANKIRLTNGQPDCVVCTNGDLTSSYALHFIKKVLNLNPLALTYNWGMLTEPSLKNISTLCHTLEIQHVVVTADFEKEKRLLQRNIKAWLKKPTLGLVPLFTVGNQAYLSQANKLKNQLGLNILFVNQNIYQNTAFKIAFAGVKPNLRKNKTLSLTDKLKLIFYCTKQWITNPSYNRIFSLTRSNIIDPDTLNLYRFIKWDEQEAINTIINQYNWEPTADDPQSFQNYIYFNAAGFTQNDVFRSNQIREGILTREQALELVQAENRPQYDILKRYCDTVGIDFTWTMKIINTMPRVRSA